jgi:hypothetical protein
MIEDDAVMRIRPLRLLTICATALALAAPAAGLAAHTAALDRGVVQSVDSSQIVLRALDGSTVSFGLLPGTRVRVNGAKASPADITPGAVADVTADDKGHALLVRATQTPQPPVTTTDRGVLTQVTKSSLVFTAADGSAHTVSIDRNTRFRLAGAATKRNPLRPGVTVQVTHVGDGPALVVNVLKRGA